MPAPSSALPLQRGRDALLPPGGRVRKVQNSLRRKVARMVRAPGSGGVPPAWLGGSGHAMAIAQRAPAALPGGGPEQQERVMVEGEALAGQVAWVTGSSRGIGRVLAERLCAD